MKQTRSFNFQINDRNVPWPLRVLGGLLSLVLFAIMIVLGGVVLAFVAVAGFALYGYTRWRLYRMRQKQAQIRQQRPPPTRPDEIIIDV